MPHLPDLPRTTAEKVRAYETATPLFEAALSQIKELAKKKPDATVSKANVARINRLLIDLRACLKDEDTSKYLDVLDDDILPQYSDALIVMSQYQSALQTFHSRYHVKVGHTNDDYGLSQDLYDWSIVRQTPGT
jgi:hypothetical protein